MTKALVCSVNSHVGPRSFLLKLFGEPDHYVYKLGNNTFADELPIHMNWLYVRKYDFFHSISTDYNTHRVYYGNNVNERLEYGLFVHNNNTQDYYLYAVPDTNQVTIP